MHLLNKRTNTEVALKTIIFVQTKVSVPLLKIIKQMSPLFYDVTDNSLLSEKFCLCAYFPESQYLSGVTVEEYPVRLI